MSQTLIQLQQNHSEGRLTPTDVELFLKKLPWMTKASTRKLRPGKLTVQQRQIRKPLRPLIKWVFDVELDRPRTPLFYGVGDAEKLYMPEFYKKVNQVIQYAATNPIIANVDQRQVLVQEIKDIVVNRRKNLRNSKKPMKDGSKKKRMQLIYEKEFSLFVPLDGKMSKLTKPIPLSLPDSETPVTTTPSVFPAPSVVPAATTNSLVPRHPALEEFTTPVTTRAVTTPAPSVVTVDTPDSLLSRTVLEDVAPLPPVTTPPSRPPLEDVAPPPPVTDPTATDVSLTSSYPDCYESQTTVVFRLRLW